MYSREFLLCCCSYLNGESEKQTHLCPTIGLSDKRAVGISNCRTNGLLDYSYAPYIYADLLNYRLLYQFLMKKTNSPLQHVLKFESDGLDLIHLTHFESVYRNI